MIHSSEVVGQTTRAVYYQYFYLGSENPHLQPLQLHCVIIGGCLGSLKSELEAIVFAPLLHDLDKIFDLRVRSVLEHVDHFYKALLVLSTSNNQLENTDSSSTLAPPELWISIKTLKYIECLH